MTTRTTQRACTRHPEWFLQPGEQTDWDQLATTEAARNLCASCPLGTTACAREALTGDTPDGVILAGIVCRGTGDTLYRLRAAAGYGLTLVTTPNTGDTDECARCHKPFADGIDRPAGTVHLAARGLCRGCYAADRRAGTLEAIRKPRPDHCIDCREPMVAQHREVSPGHVVHAAHGRCTACHRRHNYQRRNAA